MEKKPKKPKGTMMPETLWGAVPRVNITSEAGLSAIHFKYLDTEFWIRAHLHEQELSAIAESLIPLK